MSKRSGRGSGPRSASAAKCLRRRVEPFERGGRLIRRVTLGALAVLACADPPADTDRASAQRAAATEIATTIARNPGSLETICVAYSGGWDDPPLPEGVTGVSFAYAEGCQEIDGQLFAQAGASRAIWLGVSEPETRGAGQVDVRVFTSTGLDDAASYICAVHRDGSRWSVEGCELQAIS